MITTQLITDKLQERFGGSVQVETKEPSAFDKDKEAEDLQYKKHRNPAKTNYNKDQAMKKAVEKVSAETKIERLWVEYGNATEFAEKSKILADINFYRLKIKGSYQYNVSDQDHE